MACSYHFLTYLICHPIELISPIIFDHLDFIIEWHVISLTGHGRSVCVMCALLVALGLAEDWKAAEQMIREKRPSISMNTLHRKSLEEWSKHLLPSSKRSGESDVSSVIHSDYNWK
jgi:hypothetical protein